MTSHDPEDGFPPQERRASNSTASTLPLIKYITAQEATSIDEDLMSNQGPDACHFLLPQLMELAGLACAKAVYKCYPPTDCSRLLVAAGPGNQGGDGLVAARHAALWGYQVKVWYPKQGKTDLFQSLKAQLEAMEVEFAAEDEFDDALQWSEVILDSIFGFSFKGPPRPPFAQALESLSSESRMEFESRKTRPPIVSVDIPSGWSVDEGRPTGEDKSTPSFTPEVVLSLTAPKIGMKGFSARHLLGGRFVPEKIIAKYGLQGLDRYEEDQQVVDITGWGEAEEGSN